MGVCYCRFQDEFRDALSILPGPPTRIPGLNMVPGSNVARNSLRIKHMTPMSDKGNQT